MPGAFFCGGGTRALAACSAGLSRRSWVEHDPAEIMERAKACMEGALDKARAACGPVCVLGLGVTNQRETTVVWCKTTGRALMNAIVWLDTRTRSRARPQLSARVMRGRTSGADCVKCAVLCAKQ
jgi:glycerol kinase